MEVNGCKNDLDVTIEFLKVRTRKSLDVKHDPNYSSIQGKNPKDSCEAPLTDNYFSNKSSNQEELSGNESLKNSALLNAASNGTHVNCSRNINIQHSNSANTITYNISDAITKCSLLLSSQNRMENEKSTANEKKKIREEISYIVQSPTKVEHNRDSVDIYGNLYDNDDSCLGETNTVELILLML